MSGKGKPMKNRRRWTLNVILIVSVLSLSVCVLLLAQYYYAGYRYRKQQKQIADMIHGSIVSNPITTDACSSSWDSEKKELPQAVTTEVVVMSEQPENQLEPTPSLWQEQYQTLVSANSDCVGYLEIPGTAIQFPIMFSPQEPEKYLYRDFFGKNEKRGTPFLDQATVLSKSQNYIIYGHNMKDGSAFGALPSYLDKNFCEEHRFIYFNAGLSEGVYEVIAVCKTEVLAKVSEEFKYYQYGGPLSQVDFEAYIQNMRKMSVYSFEMDIEWGDELLTLSTCYHRKSGDDGRLIVVAKRIR